MFKLNADKLTTILGILSGIAGGIAVMFPDTAIIAGPIFAMLQGLKGYYTNKS